MFDVGATTVTLHPEFSRIGGTLTRCWSSLLFPCLFQGQLQLANFGGIAFKDRNINKLGSSLVLVYSFILILSHQPVYLAIRSFVLYRGILVMTSRTGINICFVMSGPTKIDG